MTKHESVVILIASDLDPNSALNAEGAMPLGEYKGLVTVIASRESVGVCVFPIYLLKVEASLANRIAAAAGLAALGRWLVRSPLGRLLNSLNPYERSRVFWRALRLDRNALELLSQASLVVAADLSSTRAAWALLHSGKVRRAVYTLAAARRELLSG